MTSQITCSPKASPTFDRVGSRIEGRGVPVVLLHSSMSSKGQWRELIHRMRDRRQLIAIDLHGYGETSLTQSADCFARNDEVRLVESVLRSALRHMAPVTHPALAADGRTLSLKLHPLREKP